MLGDIIGIEENTVLVKLKVSLKEMQGLLNLYVVMEEEKKMIITA